ncbi:hypothetical protein V3C99_015216 [Haemonchus contortus]
MELQNGSSLVRLRLEEVLSRHTEATSTSLPGAYIRILPVEPLIQNGPQCGLVALSMATKYLGLERKEISEILECARKLGFTNHGEMFSAEWLRQLASSMWPVRATVISIPEASKLLKLIDSGKAVLIAYDCAKNFEPALRNGHGAHWALLAGYAYVDVDSKDIRPATDVVVKDEDAVYVFAYHGKSKHMGLWSYSSLWQSSLNLFEAGPERKAPTYVLPHDGLDQLRGKCVLLEKDASET